jgi:hypothetical protein
VSWRRRAFSGCTRSRDWSGRRRRGSSASTWQAHGGERSAGAAARDSRRARIELPDDATLEQLDAWLELAELVSDDTFLEHYRAKPKKAVASSRAVTKAQEEALQAIRSGAEPDDEAARPIVRRWLRSLARQQGRTDERALAAEMLRAADSGRFDKEQRFWTAAGGFSGPRWRNTPRTSLGLGSCEPRGSGSPLRVSDRHFDVTALEGRVEPTGRMHGSNRNNASAGWRCVDSPEQICR